MIRVITRNFWWKAASLAGAFGLWFSFSGTRELTTSVTVPVQYRNIPKNLEISSDLTEQVHLILRGPSPLLRGVAGSQSPVIIDLSDIRGPGQRTFTVDGRNMGLSPGVILERAIPAQIRLRLETRARKDVPVHARFENVPQGMRVAEVEVRPRALTIVGPQTRIAAIEHVETDPVDIRDLDSNGEIRTTAFAGDPQVYFAAFPSVTLKVKLAPGPRK
ncbi:MAG: YbbR-like domain-containing protein [Candidatus Solibacter usitatus]|nr:YbbR-like domain-containing protein [Candidatus Solibacter usitatus]